ncbi:hypothetical protein BG003_008212 [Podila horticola]|nr:hypothetical protein BG003_008212 [Podila horticola]
MVDHNELIAQFVSVSGATAEQAQFYLEANNWDINAATSNFYEEPDASTGGTEGSAAIHDTDEDEDEDMDDIVARTGSTSDGKRKADSSAGGRRQGGIATFRDITKDDSEEESDSDQESQNYFAGGEKSGVMLQGPPGKKDPNALVEDILKKAAKGGQAPEEEPQPQPKKSYFTGSGNRLGSEGESSSSSAPVAPQTPTRSTPTPEALETVTRHLTFWRNGYSLDDGPLMSYTDPANREFLDAINRGQAPIKYLNIKPGQPVEMRVAKRMDEDYKEPPKAPPKAFEGAGNRLGSVASPVSGSSTPGSFPGQSAPATSVPTPPRSLQIDESQPVTSIQIRLADGSRMVARFNQTHTVNDIRGYINASQAGESSRPYVLQTSFPKKDLEDVHQTVKDAGLLNAVVLQRYL